MEIEIKKNEEKINNPAKPINSFMKMLEVKSKELEKKMEKSDDLMKLSLKERLALKASQGNINDYFHAVENYSTSTLLKNNPYSLNISNDDVLNDIISFNKKENSEEKK